MMQSVTCSSTWLAATLSSDARILSLSPSVEQYTGYAAQELMGQPITKILANPSAFEVPRFLDAAKEWGHWQGDIFHRSRNGKPLDARGTITLLAGKQDLSAGYLLISNLNQSQILNEGESSAVAEVAVKLRAFAHDLNNPLAVTMGFAQLLTLNQNCPGDIRKDIEKLYSELSRVVHVVERLHEYAISLCEKPNVN
jgi:PAS domain S-box-containing protein